MSLNVCNSYCTFSNNWCSTQTQLHEVEFDWVINNFYFHEAKGTELKSSSFSATTNDKFKWHLTCKPNGKSELKDTISIFLFCAESLSKNVFGKFTISLLDHQRNVMQTVSSNVCEFTSAARNRGRNDFFKKDENFKNELLENDTLMIHCSLRFAEMNDVNILFHQCEPKVSPCSLSKDFAQLLDHPEFSDVILSVNDKTYKAHKNILAARSPVFAAMFRHNTTETEQNRVVIEDLDEDVMGEMLKYIYTGKCENLNKFADGLLAAADKYALDQLKMICAEELSKTLSAETASNILILADLHGIEELKIVVMKFIADRFVEVSNTTDWKNIALSHPRLVGEICEALARSMSSI